MVVRLIIHFHGTSPIQAVQNWKLVVLNWLTCSIWPCQENRWDTHEYSPMYIAIFKVRQSSIFIVSGYGENGWIFNTWEHLGIIKCTWPSKFSSYILALTHNRKSIFLIRYMGMFERLSLERSLKSEVREQLSKGKSSTLPLCLPRNSRQLEDIASKESLVLLIDSLISEMGTSQSKATHASMGSGCPHIKTHGKLCRQGHWPLASLKEETLIPKASQRP